MITTADVRNRIAVDPSVESTHIAPLIASAVTMFERMTGRLWLRRTGYQAHILVAEPGVQRTIWLPLYPITSLAIVEWDEDQRVDDAETVDAADYDLQADIGSVRRVSGFWSKHVRATITGGYADAASLRAIPEMADIPDALVEQVAFQYERNSGGRRIVSGFFGGKGGQTFLGGVSGAVNSPIFEQCVAAHRAAPRL